MNRPASISPSSAALPETAPQARSFLGHPLGLSTLFFIEMWERFSYYGMRAFLILFMTAAVAKRGLGLDTQTAGAVYGLFTSGAYLCSLPGGWLADRLLGQRHAVLWGGALICIGNLMLAIPAGLALFYGGLAVIALGTGLLKTNSTVIVGQLYQGASDSRRDAGFSIFYLGINLGAFLAPFVAGTLAEEVGYRWGFAAAGCAMLLGLAQYRLTKGWLGDAGLLPAASSAAERRRSRVLLFVGVALLGLLAAGAAAGWWSIDPRRLAQKMEWVLALIAVGFFAAVLLLGRLTVAERRHVAVIVLFFVSAAIFWAGYEQAGTTLNLFARDQTDRSLFGRFFATGLHPVTWYQSIAPLFVLLLAPVFAWIWVALGRRKLEPSGPTKLGLGLLQLGGSFLLMMLAAQLVVGSGHKAAPGWLVATYFLQTTGELCLSPIGLSNVSKLAPARLAGQLMGVWLLSISIGDLVAGLIGGEIGSGSVAAMPAQFLQMAWVGLISGAVLLAIARPVRRWMASA
ncbi:MAG TPA: peptide MFS transporter [Steroidobacteraceae bacterium]|nr:peptide MFS transporter [Steroidobacteraceae bacterium]